MKAYLVPADQHEHAAMLHATRLAASIYELDRELRDKIKHGHDLKTADEAMERIRNAIREKLEDAGVPLEVVFEL